MATKKHPGKPARMSQSKIDKIMTDLKKDKALDIPPIEAVLGETAAEYNPEPDISEPVEEEVTEAMKHPVLQFGEEYDTLDPITHIRDFAKYINKCLSRYEECQDKLLKSEQKIQDLLHFMEMTENKPWPEAYRLYKELTTARKERRCCKNEIELLSPIYELFHGTKLLGQLSSIQGNCRIVKEQIEARGYTARTDVLYPFVLEEKTKAKKKESKKNGT